MNSNIRIARELVRIAKELAAGGSTFQNRRTLMDAFGGNKGAIKTVADKVFSSAEDERFGGDDDIFAGDDEDDFDI